MTFQKNYHIRKLEKFHVKLQELADLVLKINHTENFHLDGSAVTPQDPTSPLTDDEPSGFPSSL